MEGLDDLSVLNPQPTELPGPDLLHHLIREPDDSIALDYLGRGNRTSLTYRQLHDAADALARRICRAVGEAQAAFVVPVLVPQSPHLYIALLAILKAGGAFCPLNVDAPPDRVNFILNDVCAGVVVASSELASNIPSQNAVKVLLVDKDEEETCPDTDSPGCRAPSTRDLAYVMYTSGSTGVPKGVGISHSAVTQALLAHDRHVPAFSRFLQFAAPTFDVSVFEIFFPLLRGSTLISVDRREMLNDLPGVISEMEVDACELTPTVAASLLRKRENVPTLQLLLTIGEMLNEAVIREFGGSEERKSLLWAMYGPTEATIHCTVQEAFAVRCSIRNIGVPLPTVSCFIVEPAESAETSRNVRILPRGEIGELAVGGHQLADGYINRPEQTASSFIPSPYGTIYRTGDKARIASDGTIEIFGRLSEGQVKLRGQRLELGEVQSAVLKTPGCHLAVGAVVDSILVVFCVADAGVTEESIMDHCRSWLPQYMMPGEIVLMDEFPRLPSGKVDTKRLKAEFRERKASGQEDDAASLGLSDAERTVLSVISDTLGFEAKHDMTLASAGIDSLVAIKVASALRSSGFNVSVAELLSMRTIAQICSTLRPLSPPEDLEAAALNIHLMDSLSSIAESNHGLQKDLELVEDVLVCSALQVAMLSETAHRPEAYWNEIELEASPGFTPEAIRDAFHLLARQRDVLRAGFVTWQGSFVTPIFKSLRSDQVQIVENFLQPELSEDEALLWPLRVQIRQAAGGKAPRILMHVHHAIYDGWSMDIILSELTDILCERALPQRPQFSSLLTYMTNIPRDHLDTARSFWAEYLVDWNKPSRPKLSARPAEFDEILSVQAQLEITTPDRNALAATGYGSQVYFQAALALVWGSIVGTSDVLLGSVTSGRTVPVEDIAEIVGPAIASLPLRVDVNDSAAISDVLRNINESNRKIMEHCTLPLSDIKKLSRLQAAESLYDVLFVYQESLYTKRRKDAALREVRHLDRLETKLLLEVEPNDAGYTIQATHHTDWFPSDVVSLLVEQVKDVFRLIVERPNESIRRIKDAVTSQTSIANTDPKWLRDEADLATLFEAAAAKTPDADAICFSRSLSEAALVTDIMSYQTLNQLSNQIARFLLDGGAEPGQVIAIVMQKSPLLYASILGIVKARCAYLPLLPSIPVERVKEIFRSANIRCCVVDTASLRPLQEVPDIQFVDVESAPLDGFENHNLDIPVDMSRLAYVIYTSGTTGVPKGVAVSQKSIVSNVMYLASIYPSAQRSSPRLLQACSQAFDVSVFEIFFAWHAGMCLCAAVNDDLFEDLEHSIRQFQITHLSLTPTVASLVDPKNVPTVEFLVTAGEPMTLSVLDSWGDLLWQGYGPSETTNICSVKRMKPGDYIEHLGWCFPNTSVFVLCPNSLSTMPMGWIGEFCFGGEQVADGYLNMPDLTAEKFISHPDYGLIYRSGDMGRMLPDKSLLILGRIDDQLKLKGQRIEAGEVNSVITSHSSVHAAVTTLVRRDDEAAHQLASFYTFPQGPTDEGFKTVTPDAETHRSLFAALLSRLPSYMIPSYLIPVSRIPLTSSGKVDRRKLQSCFENLPQEYLESVSSTITGQDDAEWNTEETRIAEVIARSLGVSRSDIGRWTPFATIGLDSISAIGVSRSLSTELEHRVPISAILQNSSIAQLARFLQERPASGGQQKGASFFSDSFVNQVRESFQHEPYSVAEILPCSPLQEAMLSQGQGSYYNRSLLRLHVPVDEMRGYWDEMTRRHAILRTCFVTSDSMKYPIAQVVLENWTNPWKEFTSSTTLLDEVLREHLSGLPDPLDTKIPPLSFAIIRQEESTFLSLICHHALYDGVAMENLWREVEALAHGQSLLQPVPYSSFLREALSLPDDTEMYWRDHFRGYEPVKLFTQPSRSQIIQCTYRESMDVSYGEVKARLRSLGVSLLSLCQAAWVDAISVCSDTTDVCFGLVMSGRTLDIEGIDRLVAPCFNTIPIRQDVSTASRNIDLAKSFQRLNSDVQRYQFSPLRLVQKLVTKEGRRLFDTLLLLQSPLQDMDAEIWTLEEDEGEMDIPVVCEIVPHTGLDSLAVNMHYDKSVVSEDVASVLADVFKYFFRAILYHPSSALPDRSHLQPAQLSTFSAIAVERHAATPLEMLPQNDAEWTGPQKKIRQVLATLSKVQIQRIHPDTSIFQLGLDSINAVQVASMLRREGFEVSASDVIECQNCARLADRIAAASNKKEARPGYDLDGFSKEVSSQLADKVPGTAVIEAVLPSTPLQCAMLVSFIQSQGQNYFNLLSFAVDDTISEDALIAAWKALQSNHPMLRAGFAAVQHQHSSFAMLRYQSSSGLESTGFVSKLASSDEVRTWKEKEAAAILEHLNLPPWRVSIVEADGRLMMNVLIHHALYDAHSLDQLLDDLSMLLGGRQSTIRTIEPALNELLYKSLSDQSAAQEFWKEKAELAVVNTFPVMTPLREDARTFISHEIRSTATLSALQSATKQQGVSIQAVIQAAWTRILSSYLGEDSVVFGVILSGRDTDVTRDAPLPCMNTIPVIASNQPSNSRLTRYMMAYNADVHRYQYAPLTQIQKWLGHPATPVFDTLLVYQKLEKESVTRRPWKLMKDDATVDYPVSLEVKPTDDDEIQLCITFFSDILPREQAELLVRQFDAMMIHIATEPDGNEDGIYRPKPDLYAITPPVSPELPAPVRYLHQFVEKRAVSHPNDAALEFVSRFDGSHPVKQVWTYAELDKMGNRTANLLKDVAAVGSIVAIHFDKCPEAYFSILGILKAGCAFVALDPSAPRDRKEFILRDSQAPCLLTTPGGIIDFETDAKVVPVDLESVKLLSAERRDLGTEFTPEATCYCLYTSGTTGTPKGCEITHDNSVQAMMAFQELFKGHWSHDSRWLQFAALHFDVSVLEQYWSWSVGITVVAAPRDVILDDLIASINNLEITHIDLTPSLARLTHPDEVPGLCKGVFITGGEQLKQEILDAWGPKAVIYNAYGPTEATIGVTMYQRVPINGRPSNIGKQFPNVGSYVLRKGTEVPVLRGAVGELCVSGRLVGKGYLNRPELTEERFPTLSEFGERIYRTGDLVRILHDGCFDFLGRADDQVKLRGQRLEIGEINHVIRTGVPDIRDVATVVIKHSSSGKDVLVSFLVGEQQRRAVLTPLTDDGNLGVKAREACRAKLPGYMIPTYFLLLPFIPLSPNNKVEAKELKKLFNGLSHEQLMDLTAPKAPIRAVNGEASHKVAQILSDFTGIGSDAIEAETSIFDLGVDSISALQLSTAFKKAGFAACSPAILLRNPIVADLTAALYEKLSSSQNDSRVKEAQQRIQAYHHRYRAFACNALHIGAEDVEYIAPCSALQQGIISKSMTEETRGTYFNSFVLNLDDDVAEQEVKAAWTKLVTSEAVLRTAFVKTTEGYIQVALKNQEPRWIEQGVRSDDDATAFLDSRWEKWVRLNNNEHIIAPLEVIYIKGPDFKKLVIHIFHAIYDGNSFELMLQQLKSNYMGKSPASSPSFIEALSHGPLWRHDDCRGFWENHLRGWNSSSALQLSSPQERAVSQTRVLHGSVLEDARRNYRVTLQPVMMALWIYTLQKYYSNGLTIGLIVSGRSMDLPGVENTIGPLFNTVPFFNKSLSGQSWASLIRRCSEFSTSILPFQHVPLKSIQKWCSGGKQLFDNLFVFEVQQQASKDEEHLWTVEDGPLNPDYPLALEAKRLPNGDVQLTLVAQRFVANESKLRELLDEVEKNIGLMAADTPFSVSAEKNGVSHSDDRNGFKSPDDEADGQDFDWTDQALSIRDAIASMSGLDACDISASKTILELGLDSIDVIQLSARLKQRGLVLPASQIMRQQTIAKMAVSIEAQQSSELSNGTTDRVFEDIEQTLWKYVNAAGLDTTNIEAVLPPTPLQESMAAMMIHSNFEWYFNHDLLEVAPGTDIERLRRAFLEVIDRSPILRTGFLEVDDLQLEMGYCQIVRKHWNQDIKKLVMDDVADMSALIEDAKRVAKEGNGLDALFQLRLMTCKDKTFVLVSIAHALYDGWSLSLFYQDLEAAYQGTLQGRTSAKPFLQKMLASATDDAGRFWAGYLDGAAPSILPKLPVHDTEEKSLYRREGSAPKSVPEVLSYCKKQSISLQVLMQACWALVLAHRIKALDVTFGVIMSGRDFDGAEEVMFPTMNTVAIRCILHGSSASFLRYLEASMADIRDHQSYPLRKIQKAAHVSSSELFNTLFMLQKFPYSASSEGSLLKSVDGASAVDYPVSVEAEAVGDDLVWRVACQSQYVSGEGTERLIQDLNRVLEFLANSEDHDILSFHNDGVSIGGLPHVSVSGDFTQVDAVNGEYSATHDVNSELDDMALAIRKVLGYVSDIPAESIRPESNLYHLGLDSISAIKLSSLLRKEGLYLSPRDFVRASSISHMGRLATRVQTNGGTVQPKQAAWTPAEDIDLASLLAGAHISQDDVEMILPALPMQVYMISAWQNAEGHVFYPKFRYLVEGTGNIEQVQLAWQSLVAQTPILRTVFLATKSAQQPILQVILKSGYRSAGDAAAKPMVRFNAAKRDDNRVEIRLKIHHALYDGVSIPAILERFKDLLRGTNTVIEQGIEEWSRHSIQPTLEESRQSRRSFWISYLQGCSFDDDSSASVKAGRHRVSHLKKSAVPDIRYLQTAAKERGISLQALLFAAYAKILVSSNDDSACFAHNDGKKIVVFGIYLANRANEALPLAFPTLNLVPLRVCLAPDDGILDIAGGIQEDIHLIAAEGRADVGLWEIAAWTGVKVTSFFNFLTLPNTSGEEETNGNLEDIELVPVDYEEVARQNMPNGDGEEDEEEEAVSHLSVVKNPVRDVYPAAIDIEASIQGTSLDIGVFGSRQRVSDEGAVHLVDEIVSCLQELDDEDDAEMAAWASSWVIGNGKMTGR
ncbi:non-ribosomal peptide synthetase, siderophore synthesis [Trichoderma citrinoviride]|uniref:Non-ribosomal peptide synthetase, siderophore synthesis n=1 Tax=Trichoderma citrinoviride TaxID=58853 RepID=A0A2T4B8K2_9HYPO|nr:non-ribosomal peptide synthetase, siderophore synthesis [Trichoderma citrinoviride]PTB65549.1 non-ribosomal peptide synthetase, siderophore synthesis [Trichoderma citrinoviride]